MKKILATASVALMAGLAFAPTASAVSAEPEDTGDVQRANLVTLWYQDFLGREPDPGAVYWLDRLETQSPTVVLNEIQDSPEFAEITVEVSYQFYLERSSEPDRGADVWRKGIQGDMAPEWMDQNILASPEYTRAQGNNPVDEWYSAILGREGDNGANPGEEAYWTARVKAVGPLNAVREIWYSPEAVDRRIDMLYLGLLARASARPSEGETAYWREPMRTSLKNTAIAFAVTPEYQARANEEAEEG